MTLPSPALFNTLARNINVKSAASAIVNQLAVVNRYQRRSRVQPRLMVRLYLEGSSPASSR
jgi:hypothetical protein